MPKRTSFLFLLIATSLWSLTQPVNAQALVPYLPQLDAEQLEQQGLSLAQEAAQLAQFQQYGLALTRAQLASQLLPDNADVWALLGSLQLQLGETDPAIEALLKARSLDRSNSAVLFALGTAYFQKGNYDSAVQYIQAGLRLKPDNVGALFDLGNAFYKLEQYDKAIAEYQKAMDLDPQFWPAVNNIGLVLYEQGDVAGALERWQEALAIDNTQAEPQMAIAVVLYSQGQTEEGLAQGEAALRTDARYGDLQFLEDNLWGEQLLSEAETFLSQPRIRETLARLNQSPLSPPPPSSQDAAPTAPVEQPTPQ
ncbi:tetratricopeptide repeat protein [Thermocoleostomius sinensis]|uniref:Tetratricopeptide repeat protein n=1 Tax=Thermocoleostomius sinensis A174 TaxID=2016057 RepID=A0A9E8ZG89_9CYAN|nr:tetratricopeptide repeat protein [Thermocoleostomius sinensis]WAL62512.1 tetratricopeptide repeat protein [Thermocoleostomius sinensis A174]